MSGEYAQLTHDGKLTVAEYGEAMMERLTVYRRAGGDTIITYFAKQAAQLLAGTRPASPWPGSRSFRQGAATAHT